MTAQAQAANAQTQVASAQLELVDVQTQVAGSIAELNAIAPGATQGAFWTKIIPEVQLQSVISQRSIRSNSNWLPMERQINNIVFTLVPSGCLAMGQNREGGRQCFDTAFWIGQTEVSNVQYADFVEAGGYGARSYWTNAGWAWKTENNVTAPQNYSGFIAANQPRVGITWYEAVAYTSWLTEQLRASGAIGQDEEIRLPTESEWEYAARGPDGLTYPWGNKWDELSLNFTGTLDGYGEVTAPVGSYPQGASWIGALNMAGNVYEWVLSAYAFYPYDTTDGRNDISDNEWRVLRGGAFNNILEYRAKTTYRYYKYPYNSDVSYGMRLVLSATPMASLTLEGSEASSTDEVNEISPSGRMSEIITSEDLDACSANANGIPCD